MTTRFLRLALSAATAAATVGAGLPAAAAPAQVDRSTLHWSACPADLKAHPKQQCAAVRVPLDYRQPDGRQITITLSRIRAADPGRRLGALVLSPGGPGVGGLGEPSDRYGKGEPPDLRNRYDLIGFDARGIRHSTPITCGLPAPDPLVRYPAPDGSIDHTVTYAQRTADACLRRSAGLLPHITTANTARDLDRIRAALGEQRISYVGLSYGTYLGAVYTTLFPERTDRFVLDSAIDPNRIGYDFVRLGGLGVAQRLPDATAWIAEHHATYGLGRTADDVHQRYRALTTALDTAPVAHPQGTIDGNWLRHYTLAVLRLPDAEGFADLAAGWQYLAGLTAAARRDTGTMERPSTPVADDNQQAVFHAVTCGDVAWSRNVNHYTRAVEADRLTYPDDAGRSANITPCAFWPMPAEAPVRVTDHGPRNILILQNRRDPATPWISGHGLHRALGQRSTLISADSGGHGVIGTNECATNLALDYLTTDPRTLPTDQNCPTTAADPKP